MRVGLEYLITRRTDEIRNLKIRAKELAETLSREIDSGIDSFCGPNETVLRAGDLVFAVAKLRAAQSDLNAIIDLVRTAAQSGQGEVVDFPKHVGER